MAINASQYLSANSISNTVEVRTLTDYSGLSRLPGASPRYLTAMVDGNDRIFANMEEKFDALAASWEEYNLGRPVIDYHDFAFEQILGMGAEAVPFLIHRVARGESEWVYALKCITGQEAETLEMQGDEEKVIEAWKKWGMMNGQLG